MARTIKPGLNQPTNNEVVDLGDLINQKRTEVASDLDQMPPMVYAADDLGDEDEDELISDIDRVLAEVGQSSSNAQINVYRTDTENPRKPDAYLCKLTPREFSLDEILRRYGGGEYRVRGYHPKTNGAGVRMFMNRTLVLEEPKVKDTPVTDTLSPILSAISAMQASNEKMLHGLASIVTQNQPKQESRSEMLREMMLMKELFSTPQAPVQPAAPVDPMKMFKDMLEMQALMSGGGEGGSPLAAIGMKFFDLLQNHVKPANPLAAPVTQSRPMLQQPEMAPQINEEESLDMSKEKAAVNMLIAAATNNEDKKRWGNILYENLPDEVFEVFIGPDWFTHFSAYDGRIVNLKPWFEGVRNEVISIYEIAQQDTLTKPGKSVPIDENSGASINVPGESAG